MSQKPIQPQNPVHIQAHIPVMLSEVLAEFAPVARLRGQATLYYLDGTLGRGGHLRAILEEFPQVQSVGLDRDPHAISEVAGSHKKYIEEGRLRLQHGNFMVDSLSPLSPKGCFDLVLVDLGVSSPQLDQADRGFSFYHDGPLDMRMDPTRGLTAAELIADCEESELVEIFQTYGEIRNPRRVVRAIVHDRKQKPFTSTRQLAGLIERVEGWSKKGFHPATTYFLALRLVVNREIQDLEEGLKNLIQVLSPGGRLAVLSFHSLEDRIVKFTFRDSVLGTPVHKRVIVPGEEESKMNPRARSAKLRVFERATPPSSGSEGVN